MKKYILSFFSALLGGGAKVVNAADGTELTEDQKAAFAESKEALDIFNAFTDERIKSLAADIEKANSAAQVKQSEIADAVNKMTAALEAATKRIEELETRQKNNEQEQEKIAAAAIAANQQVDEVAKQIIKNNGAPIVKTQEPQADGGNAMLLKGGDGSQQPTMPTLREAINHYSKFVKPAVK